jgi:hypothetical protein
MAVGQNNQGTVAPPQLLATNPFAPPPDPYGTGQSAPAISSEDLAKGVAGIKAAADPKKAQEAYLQEQLKKPGVAQAGMYVPGAGMPEGQTTTVQGQQEQAAKEAAQAAASRQKITDRQRGEQQVVRQRLKQGNPAIQIMINQVAEDQGISPEAAEEFVFNMMSFSGMPSGVLTGSSGQMAPGSGPLGAIRGMGAALSPVGERFDYGENTQLENLYRMARGQAMPFGGGSPVGQPGSPFPFNLPNAIPGPTTNPISRLYSPTG